MSSFFIFVVLFFGWDDFWAFGLITKANRACVSERSRVSPPRWQPASDAWCVYGHYLSLCGCPSPHILCLLMRAGIFHGGEIEFNATSISRCSSASTSSDTQKVLMMLTLGSVPNGKLLIEGNENGRRRALRQRKEQHNSSTSSSSSHFLPLFPSASCSAGSVGEFH